MGKDQLRNPFDRGLVAWHRQRSAARLGEYDFLQQEVTARLVERLGEVKRPFRSILNLGGGRGIIERLRQDWHYFDGIERMVTVDLTKQRLSLVEGLRLVASEDHLPFAPRSFDLILCPLTLHWVGDLPGVLAQLHAIMQPDSLLLASLWGEETLVQLRHAFAKTETEQYGGITPRIAPMVDLAAMGGLLQRARFSLPMVDRDEFTVNYGNLLKLFADLRGMGETNALKMRSRRPITRKFLAQLFQNYPRNLDGNYPATFTAITLTAWSIGTDQPQPLARGTGKIDLRSVL